MQRQEAGDMKILIKNIQSLDTSCLLENVKPHFIDDVRWKKIQSLKMDKDKLRSLASRDLLYKMCVELGIENPRYEYGEKGKPYMAGYENITFNLSHSGEYAVLAYNEIGDAKEDSKQSAEDVSLYAIGIDIQQIRPLHDGMETRILHKKEQVPEGISKEEEIVYLNRVWCIKESYAKMTGEGLALDFRKIFIDFEKGIVSAKDCKTAYFREHHGLSGYALSICATKSFNIEITECVQPV